MTDRLDNIAIFVAVAEQESFAEAARRLNRTPAAVTRAVAALEEQLRIRLLNRTTRSVSLTDEGTRYLEVGRRLLATYNELQGLESGPQVQPHGMLHVTAPAMFGRLHVLPSVVRFLARYPEIDVRALLLDRVVSLVDEGLDVGVRLGALPDSSILAVRAGHVVEGVYASPAYLERRGIPASPQALIDHDTISCLTITPIPDRWSFDGAGGVGTVPVKPRLIVNTTEGAVAAAVAGLGLTCLVSYQVAAHVESGALRRVLAEYEAPPIPIQVVHSAGRFVPTKVRLFIDHMVQDLRTTFG